MKMTEGLKKKAAAVDAAEVAKKAASAAADQARKAFGIRSKEYSDLINESVLAIKLYDSAVDDYCRCRDGEGDSANAAEQPAWQSWPSND